MNLKKISRKQSFLLIIIAYIAAVAAAVMVFRILPSHYPLLLRTLLADLTATATIYIFSMSFNNSSFYDPYWSTAPVIITGFWIVAELDRGEISIQSICLLVLCTLWAVRLTANWASGWSGLDHEDWRFISLRKKLGKLYPVISLLGIHLFPTLLVFFCLIPAYITISADARSMNFMDVIASVTAITAVFFEWRSDLELSLHRKSDSGNKVMSTGLWRYSRHPNYFGEVLFWFSIFLFSLAASPDKFWIVSAPLAMLCQFIFISIPLMEKRQLEKREGYREIQKKVSMFFPLPPKG